MALVAYNFSDLITLTRASTKMAFNSSGVLSQVASGAPAFSFDPVTLSARGLLIEEAVTNVIFPSADVATAYVITSNASFPGTFAVAPDGNSTMELVVATAVTGNHYVQRNQTINAQQVLTFEMWIKAGAFSQGHIALTDQQNAANSISATFNLTTPSISVANAGTGSGAAAKLIAYQNGVYKLVLTGQPTTNVSQTSMIMQIQIYNNSGTASFLGDGSSGFYVGGVSLKASATPSSYIPTVGATATRAVDIVYLTSLSPWFLASAGTIFAQARIPTAAPTGKDQSIVRFDDGTENNKIEIYNPAGTSNIVGLVVAGGATVLNQIAGTFTADTVFKVAVAYAAASFGVSINGNTALSSSSGALPSGIANLCLGGRASGANAINGELQQVSYYPVRVANSDLPALTT
jgi:hypothetical protein